MNHLIACSKSITAAQSARLYMREVAKLHGIPTFVYSDRGTHFTSNFGKNYGDYSGRSLGLALHIIYRLRA